MASHLHISTSLILSMSMAVLFTEVSLGVVFVCRDDQGHPTYTDLGCPDSAPAASISNPSPAMQFLEFAPLDDAETRRLAQLEKRLQDHARDSRRQQSARRSQQHKARADARQRCRTATSALRQLREKRRKGYSLKEAASLDERDAQLRAERASACGG